MSIRRYASLYGIDRRTVSKWRDAGLLATYQVGRCIRIKNQPPPQSACQQSPVVETGTS